MVDGTCTQSIKRKAIPSGRPRTIGHRRGDADSAVATEGVVLTAKGEFSAKETMWFITE